MKKYIILVLVLVLAVLLWGCSKNQQNQANGNEMPEDFAFSITWNTYGISSYDSTSGRLVKTTDATNPEDYVTMLILSDEQLSEIWDIIENLDIGSYPESYNPFGNVSSTPSQTIILSTVINGVQTKISCENIALSTESTTKKGKKFIAAVSDIVNIIESTKEWRSLPDYEFFYD